MLPFSSSSPEKTVGTLLVKLSKAYKPSQAAERARLLQKLCSALLTPRSHSQQLIASLAVAHPLLREEEQNVFDSAFDIFSLGLQRVPEVIDGLMGCVFEDYISRSLSDPARVRYRDLIDAYVEKRPLHASGHLVWIADFMRHKDPAFRRHAGRIAASIVNALSCKKAPEVNCDAVFATKAPFVRSVLGAAREMLDNPEVTSREMGVRILGAASKIGALCGDDVIALRKALDDRSYLVQRYAGEALSLCRKHTFLLEAHKPQTTRALQAFCAREGAGDILACG